MSPERAVNNLIPTGIYSVRGLARVIGSGPQPVYHAIRKGELKAAAINARGDRRILGAWGIEWLEARAAASRTDQHEPQNR